MTRLQLCGSGPLGPKEPLILQASNLKAKQLPSGNIFLNVKMHVMFYELFFSSIITIDTLIKQSISRFLLCLQMPLKARFKHNVKCIFTFDIIWSLSMLHSEYF